jgi:hypothetical protein
MIDTLSYNADYDGDDFNIDIPQDKSATTFKSAYSGINSQERATQLILDSFHNRESDLCNSYPNQIAPSRLMMRHEVGEGASVGLINYVSRQKIIDSYIESQGQREQRYSSTYSKESLKICIKDKIGFNDILNAEDECSICFEDIDLGIELSCSHQFCHNCTLDIINEYEKYQYITDVKKTCPYCRQMINWNKYKLFKSDTQHKLDLEIQRKEKKAKKKREKDKQILNELNKKIRELEIEQNDFVRKEKKKLSIEKEMNKRAWKNKRNKY